MPRIKLTQDEATANLRAMRASAINDHVTEGRAWYPENGAYILRIGAAAAKLTGKLVTDWQSVGVFAAFSQNSQWAANVTIATRYLNRGNAPGSGMARVLAECALLEAGADPTSSDTLGLKRADFCANLLGDMSRVTCDRWHLRAAFNVAAYDPNDLSNAPKQMGRSREKYKPAKAAKLGRTHSDWMIVVGLTADVHAMVTAATKTVAAEFGESPAACQAVIWCAVRGTGE